MNPRAWRLCSWASLSGTLSSVKANLIRSGGVAGPRREQTPVKKHTFPELTQRSGGAKANKGTQRPQYIYIYIHIPGLSSGGRTSCRKAPEADNQNAVREKIVETRQPRHVEHCFPPSSRRIPTAVLARKRLAPRGCKQASKVHLPNSV